MVGHSQDVIGYPDWRLIDTGPVTGKTVPKNSETHTPNKTYPNSLNVYMGTKRAH